MQTLTGQAKKDDQQYKQALAIMPKALREAGHYFRRPEETWEAYADRIKQIVDAYNKALTSTPDPDTLEPVEFEDKKFKGEDGRTDFDLMQMAYDRNYATIEGWEQAAKSTRAWVGRTLADGVGDGSAIYVVVKENKKTVRVKVCRGLGDDWVSRHFGEESTVGKVQACGFLSWSFSKPRELPHDMKQK